MDIKKINEKLEKILTETVSDKKREEYKEELEKLKGKHFIGIYLSGDTLVLDDDDKYIQAEYTSNYENHNEDGFNFTDIKEYNDFIKNQEELKYGGVKIGPTIDWTDEEVKVLYNDSINSLFRVGITLYPNEFDGNFDKLSKELDDYILQFKKKYDEIKNRPETKQRAMKYRHKMMRDAQRNYRKLKDN